MLKTAPLRSWRKRWHLAYQDAAGDPDDEVLDRKFLSEEQAREWADAHFVVPLWLEEHDELLGDNGSIIGVVFERHDL